jgi:hypothetical protein
MGEGAIIMPITLRVQYTNFAAGRIYEGNPASKLFISGGQA